MGLAYTHSFAPTPAGAKDVAAVSELKQALPSGTGSHGYALVLDSVDGFAFPEPIYEAGYRPLYDRAPFEESSGAGPRASASLTSDIHSKLFAQIFMRKGPRVELTAYGAPYKPVYDALQESYALCNETKYWLVVCPKHL